MGSKGLSMEVPRLGVLATMCRFSWVVLLAPSSSPEVDFLSGWCRRCRWPGWVIGCGEGGGGYNYFLSGYVLLECNLTGLFIISM